MTETAVPDTLAGILGVTPRQAEAVEAVGRFARDQAAELLGMALGQPVRFGPVTTRPMALSELEAENLADVYQLIDVRWEWEGIPFAPILLLPNAQLQTLLPAARGTPDRPDLLDLSNHLRELADHLSTEFAQTLQLPIRLSLPDGAVAAIQEHSDQEELLRVEQTLSAGTPGAETQLTVIHVIPAAALQAIALQAGEPDEPDFGAPSPSDVAASYSGSVPPIASAGSTGGGAATMEDNMTSTQPAGTSVHPVQFQPFDGDMDGVGSTNLDLLLDVGLRVSVELGRTDLTIKDVLALGPGSVVELDKLAGEPVDILVNDRLIAKGEVVVVDENFGVRVTDIVSPQRRIGKMR